ncbi:glycosyltransferase [Kriegella aquimaris]|nr:glycosyltransferase [Kriegella aquimaris]
MGSKVHENLYRELDERGIQQVIFYPVRKAKIKKVEKYKKNPDFEVIYSRPLRPYHAFLFRNKIRFLYKDLESNTDLKQFDIVHATTLFSDGALALKLNEKFNIPYIVAVRGSDVNVFFNYRKDLYFLARKILRKASRIIFVSTSLKRNFFKDSFINKLRPEINDKCVVINNGLDSHWLNDLRPKKMITPSKLVYIGNFDINKNILRLIDAVVIAQKKYKDLSLDLVGGGGKYHEKVVAAIEANKSIVTYHGAIYDKKKLKEIYSKTHILAMTSISETFGLVYVEALTQGLPIICSKNQGIDGTFTEKVGEFVNPNSVTSIAEAIQHMVLEYQNYDIDQLDFSQFDWKSIADAYINIYNSIIPQKKITKHAE